MEAAGRGGSPYGTIFGNMVLRRASNPRPQHYEIKESASEYSGKSTHSVHNWRVSTQGPKLCQRVNFVLPCRKHFGSIESGNPTRARPVKRLLPRHTSQHAPLKRVARSILSARCRPSRYPSLLSLSTRPWRSARNRSKSLSASALIFCAA
jgi:hypothetical protein